ncbi:2-aminomuconate deaminase [Lysobacter oculi]|uniref:2-aminomuconate deaminase n=1 Tax=Solilutibacter oculi TaxID=2698682 RepID=A0A344J4J7_9GAMM|nr:RidA family protein [Lysobacter oculi]AXA83957.1 2-aminomuconate deaminase [Lysobacter oculi]
MAERGIEVPGAPTPVGHYPHARRVGDLLYISGAGPRDAASNSVPGNVVDAGGNVIDHDITAQWHSVIGNIELVLTYCGLGWADVVDVTVFLTDYARDFTTYNALWAAQFPSIPDAPCRTTMEVSRLPGPIHIELKVIAQFPTGA